MFHKTCAAYLIVLALTVHLSAPLVIDKESSTIIEIERDANHTEHLVAKYQSKLENEGKLFGNFNFGISVFFLERLRILV